MNGVSTPVFGRAFWCFGPSIEAFKHCRPVLSVDGTFLTGKFKGVLLVAVSCDANNQLVPLAFALVEREDNSNWKWFMHLVRTRIIGPGRVVCVISYRHQGILNAVKDEIPGHPLVRHRWCMRYFAANYYSKSRNKALTEDLRQICMIFEPDRFQEKYVELFAASNAQGKTFLHKHFAEKGYWAQAFDEDGSRYGNMTSNMAEIFNKVLKGIRSLPVSAILAFTFMKCNVYWLERSDAAMELLSKNERWPKVVKETIELNRRRSLHQRWEVLDKEN